MDEKRLRAELMQDRIAEMEQKEAHMLEKLQQTQTNQRKAYSSLEKMVTVGYNYYS
jgi:hypothetical protein